MSIIPYQPTYSLTPQYGTRYGPSEFAPPTAPVSSPQTLGTQTPAVNTVGAGAASPQPMTYNQDPFAQPTGTGFRPATTTGYTASGTTPYVPPTTPPPMPATTMATNNTIQATQAASNGGQDVSQPDKIAAAQSLGYTRGTQNPLALGLAALPLGGLIADKMDLNKDYTYGTHGTYDAAGNVFGSQGRAYDPITGRAAQSYAGVTDYYGGLKDSYSNLRAAGESVPGSLLGSYENSLYAQQAINPSLNTAQARAAMLRGTADARGLPTIQGLIEANTAAVDPAYAKDQGYSTNDFDFMGSTPITAEMLGFDGSRPMPTNISGRFGTQPGDLARTQMGIGVINEAGQIETPQGTVISINDPYTGKEVSLLNNNAQTELARNQILEARSNPEGAGMSGFNVSDGEGGSYQTDSSGTAGAFSGGVTGMEDEYDGPSGNGGGSSGGKG